MKSRRFPQAIEPRRPKTHWDHVIEEMVWLSKDFESERKWKLAQAKKVALRASKGMLDVATRGEKKQKEEEQRLRKVALNISKDVKKFWVKIEKLVIYKHQMELDEKKKKALDKQLEFLLGQTERYSTMLAENLVDKPSKQDSCIDGPNSSHKEGDTNDDNEPVESNNDSEPQLDDVDDDVDDYDAKVEDESEDDEHTIEEDEALITAEERQEELAALHDEVDLPLEELLKRYAGEEVSRGSSPEKDEAEAQPVLQKEDNATSKGDPQGPSEVDTSSLPVLIGRRCEEANGKLSISENHEAETHEGGNLSDLLTESSKKHVLYDFNDDQEDGDFVLDATEEKDDETTLLEEEELAKEDANNPADEISLLQKESEIPLEELLARYKKEITNDEVSEDESESASALSDVSDSLENQDTEMKQKDFSVDENVEYDQSLSNGLPVIEEEKTFEDEKDGDKRIEDAAAAARSAQPTGNTFLTTKVRTKFPFLLKYPLREYQHIGLDWLVTMYEKRLNGILADEMGLGKTIMTIALLAHLACEKGIWGPHLIVVPTSVMLNWETEFLKWCPAFKILTYFGSAKERKFKRQGWMKPNSFHICITTYRLVIQDSKVFKRKKWKYLILDEAHLIKNWKSQRWQTLLNFNSKRRILLTGTPLQNDIMELWSLMHFLMPHVFHSHQEFKDWFSNPISGMVEGQEKVNKEVIDRLHNVLRPFLLRRLKRDVETQLPMKHEHVIYCRLSKRQRNLYEDFIASSETQATLASANFFGMISVIMQLRKVCNHPDLFEGRPIISSFDMAGIDIQLSSSVCSMLSYGPFSRVDLCHLGLIFTHLDFFMTSWEFDEVQAIATPSKLIKERAGIDNLLEIKPRSRCQKSLGTNIFDEIRKAVLDVRLREAKDRAESIAWWNSLSCSRKPIYSTNLRELVTIKLPVDEIHQQKVHRLSYLYSSKLAEVVLSPIERFQNMIEQVESFMFAIPAARAIVPACWCSKTGAPVFLPPPFKEKCSEVLLPLLSPIRPAIVRRQVYFPDRRLIQFDCGKLQELAVLLRKLKSEGHRALIFTQMTKMLDVLEAFINLYGYTYMRLDGSTQPEERQTLMQRFNTNPKIFLFILSTRSGGVGINLVGADTVIFYDSDWNPAMDQQAQDRCHRIGQTREVHIYRLISESTIEENILKKANQKRALDDLVIQSGGYNTEFFKKLDPMELFSGHKALVKDIQKEKNHASGADVSFSNDDVEAALKYAEDEADYMALKRVEQEEAVDNQEFTEEAIGRLEDDELVNDDDMRTDEPLDQKVDEHNEPEMIASGRDNGVNLNETDPIEEQALTLAANEDDLDMLADVKQMAAAAAAAGQTVSFENHLRPIDRYAIRFLEMWDPIVDKAAIESPIGFEETEWELDRIEKYKDEMEAEIDDDEEPFVYERWDTEFATEAYRQHVEALAQHQLMEEMEAEANEKQLAEDGDFDTMIRPKPKSKKKKAKKSKFKSLKKGSLASELKKVKEEPSEESISFDDEVFDLDDASYSDNASPYSSGPKKRRADLAFGVDTERSSSKKSKKPKKALERLHPDREVNFSTKQHGDSMELKSCDSVMEHRPGSRNKAGGKLSITSLTVKRILTIKPEKLKKGNTWSRDCVPSPDLWSPQEDTILCAVVHEYGPHWSLVSETLYGMTAGGFYRGRYRHPVHCCERFRELIQKYVLSTPENPINEKMSNAGSTKALLRVTEDHIRTLLNVAVEQPDNELLLQKHFTALLSSAWRMKSRTDQRQHLSSSRNGLFFNGSFFISSINQFSRNSVKEPLSRMKFTNLQQNSKLLASALHDACSTRPDEGGSCRSWRENFPISSDQLELTLEFQNDDSLIPFPSVVSLSIPSPEPPTSVNTDTVEDHLKHSTDAAESRFRDAAESFFDDSLGWASSAFMVNDAKSRGPSRPQTLGKHKLPISEVSKPPRSKMKRTSSDQNEARHLFAEPVLNLLPTVSPNDPNLRFEPTLTTEQDHWADDTYESPVSNVDGDLPMETSFEAVPDNYDSDLILGLDDCSLLAEYTDIG